VIPVLSKRLFFILNETRIGACSRILRKTEDRRTENCCIAVILVLLLGFSFIALANPSKPGLTSVFQQKRSATEDIIFFQNNEEWLGSVLNKIFSIHTPYGFVQIPLRNCAGISFVDSRNNRETLVTENFNRLTGIVTDQVIHFRIRSTGVQRSIRKEKIRFILFKASLLEKNHIEPYPKTDLFVMTNGDLLTGKPENFKHENT
jgi:hypothetical protein